MNDSLNGHKHITLFHPDDLAGVTNDDIKRFYQKTPSLDGLIYSAPQHDTEADEKIRRIVTSTFEALLPYSDVSRGETPSTPNGPPSLVDITARFIDARRRARPLEDYVPSARTLRGFCQYGYNVESMKGALKAELVTCQSFDDNVRESWEKNVHLLTILYPRFMDGWIKGEEAVFMFGAGMYSITKDRHLIRGISVCWDEYGNRTKVNLFQQALDLSDNPFSHRGHTIP